MFPQELDGAQKRFARLIEIVDDLKTVIGVREMDVLVEKRVTITDAPVLEENRW